MTTIINIKTSIYQLPRSFRGVIVLLCLLVMVGLQSCRTAAISATALDLNNYQTGKVISQEKIAFSGTLAYTPSVLGRAYSDNSYPSAFLYALNAQIGCELPFAKTWQTGAFLQMSATTLIDWDAGFRAYIKKELTDSLSSFSTSILIGGSIQWGTEADTRNIIYPFHVPTPYFFNPSRDTIITMTESKISSQTNRVHLALPMSWRIPADSATRANSYFVSTEYWTDICITPAVHLVHQNIYLQDSSYKSIWLRGIKTITPKEFAERHIITPYLIPSLSIGACFHTSFAQIFPEITVAWANSTPMYGLGISFRGFLLNP
ncbi:MAG: hypothetical protein JNN25_08095 [Candidatus Kapabacteria bacterium]|nr:hypothetical protein [Candidatus Kapabacteria bacterium]